MDQPLIYQALADAFRAEGMDTLFTLMGDGNMHFNNACQHFREVRIVSARHEHCAVMMAAAYREATGRTGVATVTCGPGFTQVMTALATASRNAIPLVLFAAKRRCMRIGTRRP